MPADGVTAPAIGNGDKATVPANGNDAPARVASALTAGGLLRERYRSGTVYGSFLIELPTPRAVRALALAGFDFLEIDLEHSPFDVERMSQLASEAQLLGMPAIVRVWTPDRGLIGKVLDAGANGIMVPHVASAAEAAEVVQAARYAPVGSRGIAPLISYAATPFPQTELGNDVLIVVQIEGREGLQACGSIAAVPGVDAVFVGVYDLSQSLGQPGNLTSPEIADALSQVAGVAADTMLGIYVDDPALSGTLAQQGFRLQCVSFDGRMLVEGARAMLAAAGVGTR